MSTWTRFMDMHSGGSSKEDHAYIYIEADHDEAVSVFYAKFGHNPRRVTCTCCGDDYSISSGSIESITAYDRRCTFNRKTNLWNDDGISVEEYKARDDVRFIPSNEIRQSERVTHVPDEGYVWV